MPGTRGQTARGAVSWRARTGTVSDDNPPHFDGGRLRLPGTAPTHIGGAAAHQSSPQESSRMPRAYPGDGKGAQASHGGPARRPTQPRDSRVGELSPSRGASGRLQQSGYSHLQESVGLGHTEAPKAVPPLGGEAILSHAQGTTRDLRGDRHGSPGATVRTRAVSGRRRAHSTACQNPKRSQSLCPPMGSVLRRTPWREEDAHPQRAPATAAPVETPTRPLSCVPPEEYQTYGMAQPSCSLADPGGQGCHRQPYPPAPQRPQAGS
jgi:hypothetical protein